MVKTKEQQAAWWQKGLSLALSVAMVLSATPTAALAEVLDEAAGAEDALVVVAEDEGAEVIVEDEGTDEVVELVEDEGAEVVEDEATPLEIDEEVAPEEDVAPVEEEAAPVEEEALGEEAAPVEEAEEAAAPEADDETELMAQVSTYAGDLTTDGQWKTASIAGSDVDTYNNSGDVDALEAHYWRISLSSAGTLAADVWAKNSELRWWISYYNPSTDSLESVSEETVIKKSATGTKSLSARAGTYYLFVVSNTTASGNYAVRAYTSRQAITGAVFSKIANKVYTGAAQTPAPTVTFKGVKLTKNVDYTVKYASNKKVGTAKVTITGKGLYSGSKTLTFKITKRSIKKTKITIGVKPWTGKAVKPNPVVKIGKTKLKKGVDYKIVKYVNNKNVGTAKVVIKGIGGLSGKRTIKFKIRYNISKNNSVTGYYKIGTTTFTKFVFKKTKVTMKSGRDYKLTVSENSSSKKVYKMVGKGQYYGTTYFTFYK